MRVPKVTRRTIHGQGLQSRTDRPQKLREAEGKLANGSTVPEEARELGISEATFHRWGKQYGGMSPKEAKRLKELEKENARLKKVVADQALDIAVLKDVNRGKLLSPAGERRR